METSKLQLADQVTNLHVRPRVTGGSLPPAFCERRRVRVPIQRVRIQRRVIG